MKKAQSREGLALSYIFPLNLVFPNTLAWRILILQEPASAQYIILTLRVYFYFFVAVMRSMSSFIQNPPMSERALKPTMRPVLVSYQSEMGTRDLVSLT